MKVERTKAEIKNVSPNIANAVLAAVFFSLIINTLENNLKISLKKFASSK